MRDVISGLHPIVSFTYFAFVLAFAMYFTNPAALFISLIGAFCYSFYLNGKKAAGFGLKFMLPAIIIVSIMNPMFNHKGATILAYFPDGNPLTFEAIAYGIASGCMLITVICWFSCFNVIITSDKIIYLFGRVIPSMSLVLSMTLRFVPRFKTQARIIADAQDCIGRGASSVGLFSRARHGLQILSILLTWALENSVEIADSMKSRGYGLRGRTAFSNFRFDKRDRNILTFILICAAVIIIGAAMGGLSFRYYPTMKGAASLTLRTIIYPVYTALCLLPVILNVREDRKWIALHWKP